MQTQRQTPDVTTRRIPVRHAPGLPQDFEAWFHEYRGPVYRYVRFRVATREAAEDVTSEVFMKALRSIHPLRPGHRLPEDLAPAHRAQRGDRPPEGAAEAGIAPRVARPGSRPGHRRPFPGGAHGAAGADPAPPERDAHPAQGRPGDPLPAVRERPRQPRDRRAPGHQQQRRGGQAPSGAPAPEVGRGRLRQRHDIGL
ncbi:MAG: hypothetical protein FIA95_08175 [Gemmatimonadetes bacterium]|nr:hypothetical protein [Gemmatimonadota bacterium]